MKYVVLVAVLCVIASLVYGNPVNTPGCVHRYFQHYFAKGCTPVYSFSDDKCPARFHCPYDGPDDAAGCKFEGRIIPVGDFLHTGNPCQRCSCQWESDEDDSPQISCQEVKCPFNVRPPQEGSCYRVFQPHLCCPTDRVCIPGPGPTCEYRGRSYLEGERIPIVEDPCLKCSCTGGWTGIPESDPGCMRMSCVLERDREKMRAGCMPIYHESMCCPHEYECGEHVQNTTVPLASQDEMETASTCVFKGSHYRVGQSLHVTHPSNCVTCDCVTPPEFTCVHKACPKPEGVQCTPIMEPGKCCPSFYCPSSSK